MSAFLRDIKSIIVDVEWTDSLEKQVEQVFDRYKVPTIKRTTIELTRNKRPVPNRQEKADEVVNEVCLFFNLKVGKLFGPSREHEYVHARHIIWALWYMNLGFYLTTIGDKFNRDHSTILHGIKQMRNYIETGDYIGDCFFEIERRIFQI